MTTLAERYQLEWAEPVSGGVMRTLACMFGLLVLAAAYVPAALLGVMRDYLRSR